MSVPSYLADSFGFYEKSTFDRKTFVLTDLTEIFFSFFFFRIQNSIKVKWGNAVIWLNWSPIRKIAFYLKFNFLSIFFYIIG
jgi:hypothetical protein